ncbi:hypothetical protein CDH05_04070 [Pseudomonas lactis]|nr:hypothetical protein CDH05_04070 [Pseudomonas lactis]
MHLLNAHLYTIRYDITRSVKFLFETPVGASLLAKNLNDNAGILNICGACEFFASKLAPTLAPNRAESVTNPL